MRIDVVGLPASGKSTFAEKVSAKLSIPHIHLDRFWFKSGGRQGTSDTPSLAEVRRKVREETEEALKSESWVSDGIYLHIQDLLAERADVIVFLDLPLGRRLLNHARRTFLERRRHHETTFWDDLRFFGEILRREKSSGPKLRRFITEQGEKVVRLTSSKEANDYIRVLTK